jgi:hypothetical protein
MFLLHSLDTRVYLCCLVVVSFIGGRKLEYPEENTDQSQVAYKLDHIKLYWVHNAWTWYELTALVVMCTHCIGSCKSNCHTIMTMTVPFFLKVYLDIIL